MPGRAPMYSAACRVLSAEGASLNPMEVLEALGDDMPLHLACDTLMKMMSSVIHRKRHGQVWLILKSTSMVAYPFTNLTLLDVYTHYISYPIDHILETTLRLKLTRVWGFRLRV